MPASVIHIDHLELDLRGVPPAVAQEALASLGPTLREALAVRLAGRTGAADTRVPRVSLPTVRISATANAATLCQALAGQLATTIANQLPPSSPT